MASPSYSFRGLVLRKTKLGEADLIVNLLKSDGSRMEVVAKGARKPSSTFASRMELYAVVDGLCATGRHLDILQEVRLVEGNEALRFDIAKSTAAAPLVELLYIATQHDLENPRLFDASCAALHTMAGASEEAALAISAAHLLKTLAFIGFRPQLDTCIFCGRNLAADNRGLVDFAFSDGGAVCPSCRSLAETQAVDWESLLWARYLLTSTFAAIVDEHPDTNGSFGVLRLCQQLIREHVGVKLKSLEFLFTSGLSFDGCSSIH